MKKRIAWNRGLRYGLKDKCHNCGKEIFIGDKNRKRNKHFYCSRECSIIGNKGKNGLKEDKNNQWKGDGVGYHALHAWIIRKLGKPAYCTHCGTTEAKKFEWANVDHKYRRKINDFIRLCSSCHKIYDIKYLGRKKGGRPFKKIK